MARLATALGWLSVVVGAGIYLAAVAGVLFASATPPLDVGAVTVLAVGLLFGAFGILVDRRPA